MRAKTVNLAAGIFFAAHSAFAQSAGIALVEPKDATERAQARVNGSEQWSV